MKNFTNYKVPKKYQPMIDEIRKDADGIWVYLKEQYICHSSGSPTIHEDTWKECLDCLRAIKA